MLSIDPERLFADLRTLRNIGAHGRGVVRPAFSAADMEAKRWLVRRYEDAGLEATIDGVGNMCHRPAYWSHFVIGIKEPADDRHIGASAGSA